jgi:Family of unknown function (DUF5681)
MEETSEERADFKTRWKKGQSGNPEGRPRLSGAGLTLTALARTMMERPVEGVDGGRRTRLAEYMFDVVRRADAGDLKCRMFLLKRIDDGDRRREAAQRNAKKAKSEELRKFEEAKADEISTSVAPLTPEQEEEQLVKDVRPTTPPRKPTATPAHASSEAPPRKTQTEDASLYRRDADGHLVTPEGRILSPEEEHRLANPYWPHVSPHLKKAPLAGTSPGHESPVPESQVVDSARNCGSEKFSRKSAEADADLETVH